MKRLIMRPIRWLWMLLALVAVVVLQVGDNASFVDNCGYLVESRLMLAGIVLLAISFLIALADALTCRRPHTKP